MPHPTLKEISERTGFSIATVSRALAGSPLISARTRREVLSCARETGYRSESCREVAVIMPDITYGAYFGTLLHQLQEELRRNCFVPVIFSTLELHVLEKMQFCGAISLLAHNGLETYWGARHTIPLVCINTRPRHLDGIFTVGSNDAQGMQLAVGHLIELGHRRIGRLGGSYSFGDRTNWNSYARDLAFRKLMAEHGLPADLQVAVEAQSVPEAVRQLLDMGVTALILLNEGMELEVMHALRLLGIRVPDTLSVVGWSSEATAPYLHPTLTNLEQNYMELVRCSCEIFRKLLDGEPVAEDVLVDYRFRIRSSTARPPDCAHG